MEWPIFFKDQITIGNLDSNIAICTLWEKRDIVEKHINKEKFSIIANLYTNDGINYIIRNVLANPKIRGIILLGPDLMKAGENFEKFMQKGIDKEYRILDSEAYIHKDIPFDLLEKFRKGVKLYRYDGSLEKLEEFVDQIAKELPKEPFTEPVVLNKVEIEKKPLTSQDVAYRVEGEDLVEVWLKALDIVDKFGEIKGTEFKIEQKEVMQITSVIDSNKVNIPEWLPFKKEDLDNYLNEFFKPIRPEGVDYTYGERLYAYNNNLNQVEIAKKKLEGNKNTRRAIVVTWMHNVDFGSENPPCLIQVQWLVKFNKLYQEALFRSHDIYGAWLLNAYALLKLQEKMAKELGLDFGKLIINSISAHIYKNNYSDVEQLLNEHYRDKPEKFIMDPRGYFVITTDENSKEIIVHHKLNDGRDSGYVFRGKDASLLYRRIINENLVSRLDHAAYLGKELERAELYLKEGKKYIQDKA